MTMAAKGLAKLIEECGEVIQVAGKRLAYYTTEEHPDGKSPLNERMEDELGDLLASIYFYAEIANLDMNKIDNRLNQKIRLFHSWHKDSNNNIHGIDAELIRFLEEKSDE